MAKGQAKQKKPEPCCFVIFGVTGDLTHRLVIPALYNLAASNLLPENFCVAGVARKGVSGNELRNSLIDGLRKFATRPVDDEIAMRLLACITAIEADVRDPASFDAMRRRQFGCSSMVPGILGCSLNSSKSSSATAIRRDLVRARNSAMASKLLSWMP